MEVTYPIVGKEHNLEEELCDEKAWREKAEVERVEEPWVLLEVVEERIAAAEEGDEGVEELD